MNNSLVGKYLVSKWGYSMILATYVKVIRETPKTLVVQEVKSRHTTEEEDAKLGLSYGWLQCYTVPTDNPERHNGEEQKTFPVYKRDNGCYIGCTPGSNMKHYFYVWDGKPEFEDHCD